MKENNIKDGGIEIVVRQQSIQINLLMRGSLYANPTFTSRHIPRPTAISVQPLVVFDQTRLYFNGHSIKWQAKDIVNCTYSHEYQALLILTDDSRIYVMTPQLELITVLNHWEAKFIVAFQLIESLGILLLIGTEEIELMRIKIVSNLKRTKFLSSMKFGIKCLEHLQVEISRRLKWNRGYGTCLEQDLLYVWSAQDIFFFSLSKLTSRGRYQNITKKELGVTTVLYCPHYKYTITGMMSGEVRVWRMSTSPDYPTPPSTIHNFTYHSREVEQIKAGGDHKVIITLGVDMYVCFMSMETFELLRIFNFVGEYTKIYLHDHCQAYAVKDGFLGDLNYGHQLDFVADLTGQPTGSDSSLHATRRHTLTLNSNLGVVIEEGELTREELHKMEIAHIYPPLKSKSIREIVSSPYEEGTYFLLVEDGEVFRVRMEESQGKIDLHIPIQKCIDAQKHPIHQHGSVISFLKVLPPRIDTEKVQKTGDKEYPSSMEQRDRLQGALRLLTVGCSRGSILFLSEAEPQLVYARVSYHRQQVVGVQEVRRGKGEWLVSMCAQRYLRVVMFQYGRSSCLHTIFCGEVVRDVYCLGGQMVVTMQRGLFQVCQISSSACFWANPQAVQHQDDILTVSYRENPELLLTAAMDNRVKLWTMRKVLLYEVVLEDQLQYALWASHNILIIQNSKLFCLRNYPLRITQQQVEEINNQFQESAEQRVLLSKHIEKEVLRNRQKHSNSSSSSKHYKLPHIIRDTHQPTQPSPTPEKKKVNLSALFSQKSPSKHRRKSRAKTEPGEELRFRHEGEFTAVKRHLQEMNSIRKVTNESLLPRLKPKTQDLFLDFMKDKLLNRKLVTRRDITINRIIMKNMIREQMGEQQIFKNMKLQ